MSKPISDNEKSKANVPASTCATCAHAQGPFGAPGLPHGQPILVMWLCRNTDSPKYGSLMSNIGSCRKYAKRIRLEPDAPKILVAGAQPALNRRPS